LIRLTRSSTSNEAGFFEVLIGLRQTDALDRAEMSQQLPVWPILKVILHSPPITKPKSPRHARAFVQLCQFQKFPGAGEGIRTLDPDLGKVVLYH